ncbi:hypothetical protein FN3523_0070 [Francisella hispaniensis]|uniref:Uncharacterized protein n=1 Tax=Francisella hispaniensis TaxID=622488 RepID=F4BID3_9GAMM|nr:hypothetical protein FN3523_0070 [Francisella hispaniensis]
MFYIKKVNILEQKYKYLNLFLKKNFLAIIYLIFLLIFALNLTTKGII